MKLSWKRVGDRKIHVYCHRPGYMRLLYIFEAPPGSSNQEVAREISLRDVLGVRLAAR